MTIGSLLVKLEADIVAFTSSMDKAAAIADQRMKQVDKAVGLVKTSLTALGAGFAAGLTFEKIKDQIDGAIKSASGLQEMSERTGVAADRLSGLAAVAKLSGTDSEALATGIQKLSKSLVDAQDGGKKTGEAFHAIGISVKDLKGLKPDEAFQLIAQKMALYSDGAEKTAIAQALLGKAGANLLPVMKDVADVGDLQIKLTKEQIAAANEYERNVRRLDAAQAAIWKTIGMQLVPVMNAFTKAMLESATKADGVKGAVDDLAKDGSIVDWAKNAATALGFVVDGFDGVGRVTNVVGKTIARLAAVGVAKATGESRTVIDAIKSEYESDMNNILNGTLFSDRLKAQFANLKTPKQNESGPRPAPNYRPNSATKGANDDPAGALMAGIFKQQDQIVARERKALAENEAMLQESYAQQYLSASQFYGGKKALIEDELAHELAAYDKEMSAAQAYIDQADTEQKKQKGRNELAISAAKYIDAIAEAQAKLAKNTLDANKPLRDFEIATAAVAHQAELQNAAMQFVLDMMGRNTLEVQKLTAARNIDLALQERIYAMKQKGYSADELATRVATATADAEAQKAIVIAQITSAYDQQRDSIFGAHEALRKYVEDSTNGAAQMESVVGGAFKGMENALVDFVKTGKLNFSSLVDSIIADVARMMIQQSITGPLAQWAMSGLSGMFSGAMGGGPVAGEATAFALGFAGGGDPPVGRISVVGENGPELFVPRSAGTIIPNDQIGGGGGTVVFNITNTIGDVASKSDVVAGMRTVQAQISQGLMRSKQYAGAMAS